MEVKYLKYFTNQIKNYIRQKCDNDHDVANILEKTASYVIILVFLILVLEISNIPISSLAFIGGALALGIGLGAQNIINNFISSIILAIEKPLRIGDIIEVEGIIGTVSTIGTRCITIKTDSNLEVLIPTSKLLQNTFINCSLQDNLIKKYIDVAIMHDNTNKLPGKNLNILGCEEGKKILEAILANNPYIAKSPESTVYLLNISDNSFNYEISYWHDLASDVPLKAIQNSLSFAFMKALKAYPIRFSVSYIIDAKQTGASSSSNEESADIFNSNLG